MPGTARSSRSALCPRLHQGKTRAAAHHAFRCALLVHQGPWRGAAGGALSVACRVPIAALAPVRTITSAVGDAPGAPHAIEPLVGTADTPESKRLSPSRSRSRSMRWGAGLGDPDPALLRGRSPDCSTARHAPTAPWTFSNPSTTTGPHFSPPPVAVADPLGVAAQPRGFGRMACHPGACLAASARQAGGRAAWPRGSSEHIGADHWVPRFGSRWERQGRRLPPADRR
jgi:hypothetical protein